MERSSFLTCRAALSANILTRQIDLSISGANWQLGGFGSLLECHDLEECTITGSVTAKIIGDATDEELLSAARAWRNLRNFVIDGARPRPLPLPSLHGLRCFAKYCPLREKLEITVDGEVLGDEPGIIPGSAFTDLALCLGYTVASQDGKEALAKRICAMWPKLREGRLRVHSYGQENTRAREHWRAVWERVGEILR